MYDLSREDRRVLKPLTIDVGIKNRLYGWFQIASKPSNDRDPRDSDCTSVAMATNVDFQRPFCLPPTFTLEGYVTA